MPDVATDRKFLVLESRIAAIQRQMNQAQFMVPKRRGVPTAGTTVTGGGDASYPACRFVLYTEQGTP